MIVLAGVVAVTPAPVTACPSAPTTYPLIVTVSPRVTLVPDGETTVTVSRELTSKVSEATLSWTGFGNVLSRTTLYVPLTFVLAALLPALGTHPGKTHEGQGYWVAPFPAPVGSATMLIPIDAESVPPGLVTVILKSWGLPGLPSANEKVMYTVWPKFTVDGLAEIIPVTAHPEEIRLGIRTMEKTIVTMSSLTFRWGFNPDRATAMSFFSGQ